MTGYVLSVTCLHCGSLLEHTAGSKPHPRNVSVVADCTTCGSQFRLDVVLTVLNGAAIRQVMPPPTEAEMVVNRDAPGQALIAALMAAEDEDVAAARKERKRLNRQDIAA